VPSPIAEDGVAKDRERRMGGWHPGCPGWKGGDSHWREKADGASITEFGFGFLWKGGFKDPRLGCRQRMAED